jgi:hypothetical protein
MATVIGESQEAKLSYYTKAICCVLQPYLDATMTNKHMLKLMHMQDSDIMALLEVSEWTNNPNVKDINIFLEPEKGELIITAIDNRDCEHTVKITHTQVVDSFAEYIMETELDYIVKDEVTGKSYITLAPLFKQKMFPLCLEISHGIENHKMRLCTLYAENPEAIAVSEREDGHIIYASSKKLTETSLYEVDARTLVREVK